MLIRRVGTNEGFSRSRRDTSDFVHEEKGESCSTERIIIQLAIIEILLRIILLCCSQSKAFLKIIVE